MLSKRYALTLLLILTFLVPGVYGDIHVGVSGGSGNGDQGSVGFAIGANKDAMVTGSIAANGASLDPTITISGIGNLDESHQVTDSAQNHAEIHAKVVDGLNIQYSDTLTPGEGNLGSTTGGVEANQALTVGDSKYIQCSQSASNFEGDKASAGIEIEHGSLTNYQGHALADLSSAKASQSFDAASGMKIKLYSWSINAEKDKAKAWLGVDGTENNLGNITNFAGQATASATSANASQTFKTAIGNEITFGVLSSNMEKDNADVHMEIEKGSVNNFTGQASASATNATSSGTFDNATGKEIKLATSSWNKEKDNADVRMEIKKGSVNNFTSQASASATNATSSGTFDNATGKKIKLATSSWNKEKDNADVHMEIEKGSVNNFTGQASASATNATSSGTFDNATGKEIKLATSSWNKEKDNADVHMEIKKGSVNNFTGQASASATNATSSGTFDNATGKEIKLVTSSSNKEKDNAIVNMEIKEGSVSNFTAKADTTAVNASANLVNSSESSSISGKRLVLEAKASDALGDRVRAITKVKNGTLTGGVAEIAFVDTSTNTLKASQSASTLEGTSLYADGKASNTTGVTIHKRTNIDNPSISNYQNNASVIAGTPSVVLS